MKILVLVENYPKEEKKELMYVHVRNLYYLKKGINVEVLSFRANKDYIIDGIKVNSESNYKNDIDNFDIIVCHAPNLKNHYRFLKMKCSRHKKIVLFFHGHEIVKIKKCYPKDYDYIKKSIFKKIFLNIYDIVKIMIWKKFIIKNLEKINLVFVSNSLFKEFIKFSGIDIDQLGNKVSIINNSVSKIFEVQNYDYFCEKKYDFITIRSNIDSATYCIDIVNEIAKKNECYKFLVIGRGKFFEKRKIANNITHIDKQLSHQEIIKFLNESKCALMPTRRDTQGVMVCEMATYGIPVITSDLEICKEVLFDFNNVQFRNNDSMDITFDIIHSYTIEKNKRYFEINTSKKEVNLFYSLIKK